MANIKQQKKRNQTNELRRQKNASVRSHVNTMVKHANDALVSGEEAKIKEAVPAALSAVDRAASKGVIHSKAAARKKSSIQHRVNAQAK